MICWESVKKEAADYLSQLIQINTSNPPGNELHAIEFIKEIAHNNGLYTDIQITAPNRGNIIVSLTNEYCDPIVLLSHVDVVPAKESDWEVPPFSGQVINDVLWGRGAIDAKQLTITHLMVLILLKRNNITLDKNILMIATSDEENGSDFGLKRLIQERECLFHNSIVFNEGGGFPIVINEQPYYLVEMGQKGVARFKITVSNGKQSNAYLPNNNSIKEINHIIERIKNIEIDEQLPKVTKKMFEIISEGEGFPFSKNNVNDFLKRVPVHLKDMFSAMMGTTFSITRWHGGRKHPDVNDRMEIFVDCRTHPMVDRATMETYLEKIVKNSGATYELVSFDQGYEMVIDHTKLKIFEQGLHSEVDNAVIVPYLSIGSSDSRLLPTSQTEVYGYCPMLPDMPFNKVIQMVHGVNERIPLESLRFGIKNMYEILLSIGGKVHDVR